MTEHTLTRRWILQSMGMIGTVAASSLARGAACAAPDGGDASLRQSLHYVETSTASNEKCRICGLFSNLQNACGTCAIFNGPANADGHCDSWSARS